jgi:uncharacterized protein with GYD domain
LALQTYFADELGHPQRQDSNQTSRSRQSDGEEVRHHGQGVYLTLGQYDTVLIADAPDDAAMAAFGLAVGAHGHSRTQTALRAFSGKEMGQIFDKGDCSGCILQFLTVD